MMNLPLLFCTCYFIFLLVRSFCFAPGTHQDQDYQNLAVCSPWHIIMPQKTFSTIPCPIDFSISRLVAQSPTNFGSRHGQNSQSCNFHHDIINNYGCDRFPITYFGLIPAKTLVHCRSHLLTQRLSMDQTPFGLVLCNNRHGPAYGL